METLVCPLEVATTLSPQLRKLRGLSEDEFIDLHASGTLRKTKRLKFATRQLYLQERTCYEFGFGFEVLPRTHVTFGDAIAEGDCHVVTESAWHIERYVTFNSSPQDVFECKYITVSNPDGVKREGIGIIVRQTTAQFVPPGHLVFAIVGEFDPVKKDWKGISNPW